MLYLRRLTQLINLGLTWWAQGLLLWLPDPVRRHLRKHNRVTCTISGDNVELFLLGRQKGNNVRFSFNLSDPSNNKTALQNWLEQYKKYDFVLQVSDENHLTSVLSLPAHAHESLAEIIAFEIDRQTPFSSEQVYHGFQVATNTSNTTAATLTVNLCVVPKRVITDTLAKLSSFGVSISYLLVTLASQQDAIQIPLTQEGKATKQSNQATLWLAISALFIATMCLYKPIFYYQHTQAELEPKLFSLKKQARAVSSVKQQNLALQENITYFDNKYRRYPLRLTLLNELSQRLPHNTWLESSEFKANKLILFGHSSEATELIKLLSNSVYFDTVRFTSPLRRNASTGLDKFRLEAVINDREMASKNDV